MENLHKIHLYVFLFAYCGSRLVTCVSSEEKVHYSTDNEITTKELFEAKIMEIEAKMVNLETKVAKQEYIIKSLQNGCEISRAEHVSANKTDNKNKKLGKNFIPRTCQEAYDQGMIMTSGLYIIDPDGQNVGGESEDPIEVYCDIGVGSAVKTLIGHDTEATGDVGICNGGGCFKIDIHYYASDKQIEALTELSNECHQYFKYECIEAPFEYQSEQVSWWDDRNENQQFFWSGKYTSPNAHTCDCGIYGTCVGGETKKCHCDSGLKDLQVDSGIISDKTRLPVKRLNFGHTNAGGIGLHTLGKFECSGKVFISGMPRTCADLRGLGHALNGMYLVMGIDSIENIYCDFSKLQSDNDFQKQIGKVEVKSSPTFFYVQRSSTSYSGIITFQSEHVNTDNAMNLSTGKFTAPVFGTYFFSFSGIGSMDSTLKDGKLQVSLMRNNDHIGKGEAQLTQGLSTDILTLQSTIYLRAGDQVWVNINLHEEMKLFDDWGHYTHFTGWLLQEDIVETLKNAN